MARAQLGSTTKGGTRASRRADRQIVLDGAAQRRSGSMAVFRDYVEEKLQCQLIDRGSLRAGWKFGVLERGEEVPHLELRVIRLGGKKQFKIVAALAQKHRDNKQKLIQRKVGSREELNQIIAEARVL